MSKLIDKLVQASKGSAKPLGFKTAGSSPSQSLLVIAALPQEDLAKAVGAGDGKVDAFVGCGDSLNSEAITQMSGPADDIPWGLWLDGIAEEGLEESVKAGCDCLVFEPAKTTAALLRNEGLGKVLRIDFTQTERMWTFVDQMPVDAVLVDAGADDGALTVYHLMRCQLLASLTSKPLLVVISPEASQADIRALWDAGADAIVVRAELAQLKKRLSDIKKSTEDLPPKRTKQSKQVPSVVPRLSGGEEGD